MIIGQKRLDVNSKKSSNSGKSETIDIDDINKRITQNTNSINSLGQTVGQLNYDYNLTKPYVFKNKANVETLQLKFRQNYGVSVNGYDFTLDATKHISTIKFNDVFMPISVKVTENSGEVIDVFPVIGFTNDRYNNTTTVYIFNKGDVDYSSKQLYLTGINTSYLGEDY